MKVAVTVSSTVPRTFRVAKVQGMFDIPSQPTQELTFEASLPIEDQEWHIGAIVGPSGSGKTTIARALFPEQYVRGFPWSADSVLDDFPAELTPQDIAEALTSVGLSSAPIWLRPHRVLSTGQQFRAELARALCQSSTLVCYDEFTSVVNRHVAKAAASAVAKYVRRSGRQFVAVTCHEDVLPWLEPDWVFDTETWKFTSGDHLRRPPIRLECFEGSLEAWAVFRGHHYMTAKIHPRARVFLAFATLDGQPVLVGFFSLLPLIGKRGWWRGHRTVVLPDYQGLGLGNAMIETVAEALYRREHKRFGATTAALALIAHRRRHPEMWQLRSGPHMAGKVSDRSTISHLHSSAGRLTTSWAYIPEALRH